MYNTYSSETENEHLAPSTRQGTEGNVAWLQRAIQQLGLNDKDWTLLILLGGKDQMAFRLRLAQSHLRRDMLPSYWSECLVAELRDGTVHTVHHAPLLQPPTHFAPFANGITQVPITTFDSPKQWPNVAAIAFPCSQKSALGYVRKLETSRDSLDALAHVVRWLAFIWGTNGAGNPVHESIGLPSACMAAVACAAAGLDITPGMPATAACPEAIWSAAKYWHKHVIATAGEAKTAKGLYVIDHKYDIDDNTVPQTTTKASPQNRRTTKTRDSSAR